MATSVTIPDAPVTIPNWPVTITEMRMHLVLVVDLAVRDHRMAGDEDVPVRSVCPRNIN